MAFLLRLNLDALCQPSASNYFSAVQGWHAREHGVKLAGGIKLERLPQLLKGLRRKHGDPARKLRRGISARRSMRSISGALIVSILSVVIETMPGRA